MAFNKKTDTYARRILGIVLSVLLVVSLFPSFTLAGGNIADEQLEQASLDAALDANNNVENSADLGASNPDGLAESGDATDADADGAAVAGDGDAAEEDAEAGDAQSDDAEATEADGENASDQGESVSADNSDAKDNPQDETPLATGSISGVVWADGDPNNGGS
ncbi:MAG: hypothetical protein LBG97_00005, partial [Coriobacteriales bacterium]|nr:hypothetical protein [Coriobacteriales bacterium]